MFIKKASVQGPCKGVIGAIKIVNNLLNDESIKKPIYMLGRIVHNDYITKAYANKGIIILDGDSRINLVRKIENGTVIITAHGVGEDVYNYLKEHNIDYVDATCDFVNKTKKLITEKISDGFTILYLGVKNHPECEGILSLNSNIHLVNYKDALKGNFNDYYEFSNLQKVILTCQTTLSFNDVEKVYFDLHKIIPNLTLASEVCSATRLRQSALIRECKDCDLCLVVGDKHSNNTKSLKEVCLRYNNIRCELIENVEDLVSINLDGVNSIFITSGASTPKVIVDEVCDVLRNNKPFISSINCNDYIKIK